MATVYQVYAVHPDEQYAAQAAQAAFDLVDRLERELSRFQPNSDITRINQLAAGAHTRVTPTTLECLVIARHMFELTGGAFDVSIGTGLPSLEIDPDELVVRASTSGVQVDLGGIGKGYAVDLVAELLEDWDLERLARARRLQLAACAGAAGRHRRLAVDVERSARLVARAGAALGPPDRARSVRRPQEGSHRRSAQRRTGARAAGVVGGGAAAEEGRAGRAGGQASRPREATDHGLRPPLWQTR